MRKAYKRAVRALQQAREKRDRKDRRMKEYHALLSRVRRLPNRIIINQDLFDDKRIVEEAKSILKEIDEELYKEAPMRSV